MTTPSGESLTDSAVQACPFPYYERILEEDPAFLMPDTGIWLVSRYEDVRWVLSDAETFSSKIPYDKLVGEQRRRLAMTYFQRIATTGCIPARTLERADAPAHTRQRKVINPMFLPARIRKIKGSIEQTCSELIDALIPHGRCEFVSQFAVPLPGVIIAEQVGLPREEVGTFRRWAEAMTAPLDGNLLDEDMAVRMADLEVEAQQFFAKLYEERKVRPADDLMSVLIAASDEGEGVSEAEMQGIMWHMITGGYYTTTDALSMGMYLLLTNPEQMQALRSDRSLLKNFADEVLRLAAPVQGIFRRATRDVDIQGVRIPEGSTIHVRMAAANRDPRAFPEPDKFDLTRGDSHRHLALGAGPHYCVGAPLARQEMIIAFDQLLDRTTRIELDFEGPPAVLPSFIFYRIKELPIRFEQR